MKTTTENMVLKLEPVPRSLVKLCKIQAAVRGQTLREFAISALQKYALEPVEPKPDAAGPPPETGRKRKRSSGRG
jgi:hypothetical protein